ncbi:hypothetical protein MTO96_039641, partial [Rhipicephalus appendiculatus]
HRKSIIITGIQVHEWVLPVPGFRATVEAD